MNINESHYKLNFPEMEVQHDYLFSLFGKIDTLNCKSEPDKFKNLTQEIEKYILFHFSCEEHLMKLYQFPGFAVHQSDHENAEVKLVQFMDDFDNDRLNQNAMRIFLTGWLMQHSELSDSEYVKWISERRSEI